MGISSLAYYDNNLHPKAKKREKIHDHLRRVIDAAAMLDVRLVGTFVGARPGGAAKNIKRAGEFFRDVVAYAEDRGVRIMIENCPMAGWVQPDRPGNYAYSPELWEALFNEVPSDSFGLNFDPSHLVWLGINYNRAARDFSEKLFHVHAKDAELLKEGLYRYGVFSRQLDGGEPGWWRYRMPGSGQIDWQFFFATLRSVGYDGPVSIEHEDPEYEGTEDRVKEGLRIAREHLASRLSPVPAR
jgi:sugar phosphate isomerase/epimerase